MLIVDSYIKAKNVNIGRKSFTTKRLNKQFVTNITDSCLNTQYNKTPIRVAKKQTSPLELDYTPKINSFTFALKRTSTNVNSFTTDINVRRQGYSTAIISKTITYDSTNKSIISGHWVQDYFLGDYVEDVYTSTFILN